MPDFDELVAEGSAAPVEGWDFSWFDGRATEQRPPWGYARMLGQRMARLADVTGAAAVDLQTGGGDVLATIPAGPRALVATESWPPNLRVARANLAALSARVVATAADGDDLPFADAAFDLVVSRHPVYVPWGEVARVLKPGGTYFSQDVGHGSVGELTEFMMGPQPEPDGPTRDPRWSVRGAESAGLTVTGLREFRGRMEFYDIAAVICFLRKVIWIVPGFTVDAYLDRLRALHALIERRGPFAATSVRFLIEARKENGLRCASEPLHAGAVDVDAAVRDWQTHGFAIMPGFVPEGELAPAAGQLDRLFPTADGFGDRTDPRHTRYLGDEFAGIDSFPFASVEISLLAVHERLIALAERLLGCLDIRIYSAEAWAKYTGAADYDQSLHRDYLNHTVLVPTSASDYQQVEMFLYLTDVPEALGPPHFVSQTKTAALGAKPNWYPRRDGADTAGGYVSATGRPDLYDAEVSAAGPAGTVVAFRLGTFHRGTAMTAPRGARYTMHLSYRPAAVDWGQRLAWADRSHDPCWYRFAGRATPRQLELFGFPPPGHPFWTPETLAGMALRYPDLDLRPWRHEH